MYNEVISLKGHSLPLLRSSWSRNPPPFMEVPLMYSHEPTTELYHEPSVSGRHVISSFFETYFHIILPSAPMTSLQMLHEFGSPHTCYMARLSTPSFAVKQSRNTPMEAHGEMYSSYSFMTSALIGVSVQGHSPPPSLTHPNNTRQKVKVINPLILQFSPVSCFSLILFPNKCRSASTKDNRTSE
jgi:hypothetical protein